MVPRGARYLSIDIPNRTNPALEDEEMDAVEYREFSRQADQLTAEEGPLMAVARLIAWVRPHPGPDAQTVESLRRRACALSDL